MSEPNELCKFSPTYLSLYQTANYSINDKFNIFVRIFKSSFLCSSYTFSIYTCGIAKLSHVEINREQYFHALLEILENQWPMKVLLVDYSICTWRVQTSTNTAKMIIPNLTNSQIKACR